VPFGGGDTCANDARGLGCFRDRGLEMGSTGPGTPNLNLRAHPAFLASKLSSFVFEIEAILVSSEDPRL
jgi:hypothetical protein